MRKVWVNNGEPDEEGIITLQIVNSNGAIVSTFKGTSKGEIADALADAQVNANRRLGQLLGKPDKAALPQPEPFSDVERLKYASAVTDPNRVVETVTEIFDRRFKSRDEALAYYQQEGSAFAVEHPEYYGSKNNQYALCLALAMHEYDFTRHNLALVFDELMAEGKLELAPDGEAPAGGGEHSVATSSESQNGSQTPPEPASAPRSYATGLRSSDASAQRPQPVPRKPLVTWEMLEKMSRAEYNEKLRNPEFRRAVDNLPGKQAAAAR